VPFTFDQLRFAGVDPLGEPEEIPGGLWGYFVWRNPDDRKWYVKWRSYEAGREFQGTISTSGGFTSVEEWMFEKGDSLSGGAGDEVVSFTTTSPAWNEDGVKLRAKDEKNFVVPSQTNPVFGNIGAGQTAYADFEIEIPP
jgi:hypothetical protein